MTIDLTPDAARWVDAAVTAGHVPVARRAEPRAMRDSAEAEGGADTTVEAHGTVTAKAT